MQIIRSSTRTKLVRLGINTIGILPNGVDADHFRPGTNIGSRSLVFAGRLIPRKGWQVESEGRRLLFCNDACEERYWSFWYPRYGGRAAD